MMSNTLGSVQSSDNFSNQSVLRPVNKMNNVEYKYFEDERRFQPYGPIHPSQLNKNGEPKYNFPDSPNIYDLDSKFQYWLNPENFRIETSNPEIYIQMSIDNHPEGSGKRLYVSISGRKIQFSGKNNSSLTSNIVKDTLYQNWLIEEIGSPLNIYTGGIDRNYNIDRPFDETLQCLTNASKFGTRRDQDLAVELLQASFETYRNPFSVDGLVIPPFLAGFVCRITRQVSLLV